MLLVLAACGSPATSGPTDARSAVDSDLPPSAGWRTDFSKASVDLAEILPGGPPKDGIRSVDAPTYESVDAAGNRLAPRDAVVVVEAGGVERAYPIEILVWHEIVNDVLGGVPIAVTFCPLCGSAVAFDRRTPRGELDFGTTGNLRYSDLVMYDRQTESWWQAIDGVAIVGELVGSRLGRMPARIASFASYRAGPRAGDVLARPASDRPYGRNPYPGYDEPGSGVLFPSPVAGDDRLDAKERVVFLVRADDAIAVPFSFLETKGSMAVTAGGGPVRIDWRQGLASPLESDQVGGGRDVGQVTVTDLRTGEPVVFDTPFWFAVVAFRPDVRVIRG